MYPSKLMATLLRRWPVVLVGILVSVGLSYTTLTLVGPQFTARCFVLFLPPASSIPEGGNPLLDMGGMLASVDVTARTMTDATNREDLAKAGVSADYEIVTDQTSSGPVLLITTTAGAPADALESMHLITERVPTVLGGLEAELGVPAEARIDTRVISQDTEADISRTNQIRATVAVLGVGLALTLIITATLDSMLERRRLQAPAADDSSDADPVDHA